MSPELMAKSRERREKWKVFALVAIAVFMSTLDGSIVNIALPAIMKDLGATLDRIQWVVIVYLLVVTSLLLAFGRLSDIRGRRMVYCTGFLGFAAGSLLCALASSVVWLVIFRAIQGMGAAMLMACSPALVVDCFPSTERGRALGMVGTVVATGLTAGPVLGGLIVRWFSWHYIFYINVPIGILSAAAAWLILGKTFREVGPKDRFDWTGAALMIVMFSTFLVALTHIDAWGPTSLPVVSFFLVSAGTFAALTWVEAHSKSPIFHPDLLKQRLFSFSILAAVATFATLFAVVFLMPFFLLHPAGFPADQAGLLMMIPFVCLFFVAPVAGALSDRLGSRGLCTLGMAVMTTALFFLSRLSASASTLGIAWPLALTGIGMGMFVSPNSSAAMGSVPARHRGIASGTVATARNLGMVLGVAVAGLIFHGVFFRLSATSFTVYRPDMQPVFMAAFRAAMTGGVACGALGIVISFCRGREGNR